MSASANAAGSRSSVRAWGSSLLWTLAESVVAILLAVVIGGIGIILFSGLLPNHSAFDLGLPVAAYGLMLDILGVGGPFFMTFFLKMLPEALYDTALALLVYPWLARFLRQDRPMTTFRRLA